MMFATLDDLEGSIELLVFEKALAGVRGRARRTRSCSCAAGSTTRTPARSA